MGEELEPTEYIVAVIEVARDDLVRDLEQLASFASRAVTNGHYILHVGI